MALSGPLLNSELTFFCPKCSHPFVRRGSWFLSFGRFRCEGCHRLVQLTHGQKIDLFDKHAHLT
jgi:transposase-like protein